MDLLQKARIATLLVLAAAPTAEARVGSFGMGGSERGDLFELEANDGEDSEDAEDRDLFDDVLTPGPKVPGVAFGPRF